MTTRRKSSRSNPARRGRRLSASASQPLFVGCARPIALVAPAWAALAILVALPLLRAWAIVAPAVSVGVTPALAEALTAVTSETFDALVLDIGMPGEDGYSLMRSIRRLPAAKGGTIPAVAVTAYATLRERDDAIAAGFTAHMGKPFDPDRLVSTISEIARRPINS